MKMLECRLVLTVGSGDAIAFECRMTMSVFDRDVRASTLTSSIASRSAACKITSLFEVLRAARNAKRSGGDDERRRPFSAAAEKAERESVALPSEAPFVT